jgi:hypothetical protein
VATACPPGNCVINVTVNGTCQSPNDIVVDPIVSAQGSVNMRWVLVPGSGAASKSYSFTSNGIDFVPPESQFEVKPSPSPSEFRIMNQHRSTGDFYYFINIQGCAQKDPWIRNQ